MADKDDKGAARAKQAGLNISKLTDEEVLVLGQAVDKADKVKRIRRK